MEHHNFTPTAIVFNEEIMYSILNFCDEETRRECIFLSTHHYRILSSDLSFKWRAERLHLEKGIYHTPTLPLGTSWKNIYLKNVKKQFLWDALPASNSVLEQQQSEKQNQEFHVQVSARFKPKSDDDNDESRHPLVLKKTVLPLHQRLALIRMNRSLDSNKEAMKVLTSQGGWFGKEMRDRLNEEDNRDDDYDDDATNGPPSISEGVQLIDDNSNSAILIDRVKGLRKFQFDNVLPEHCSQKHVYETSTLPLVSEFLNGFNATCLVYGQTGSGKTHTMFGPNNEKILPTQGEEVESWGIVPRACHEIFNALEFRNKNLQKPIDAEVSASYIELYGNDVTDLLRNGAPCGQNRVTAQRFVLDGSAEVPVKSFSDTVALLNEGEKQKRKAATAMNARSSRAHAIFILTLRQQCVSSGANITSRLFLADLGGSEQLKKSQPLKSDDTNNAEDTKQRYTEAIYINLGLLALKQCVEALRFKQHAPYADSKLTMMLSQGLGGDSQTSVIVCGAQEERHVAETISAMKFGETCRGISKVATADTNMLQELLQKINDEIAECEEDIKANERWEVADYTRYDVHGNVEEVRQKTIVVGAEESRSKLESLIKKKMQLTGDTIDNVYAKDISNVEGFGQAHLLGMGVKAKKILT